MNTTKRLFISISMIFTTSFLLFSQSLEDLLIKREIETIRKQNYQQGTLTFVIGD